MIADRPLAGLAQDRLVSTQGLTTARARTTPRPRALPVWATHAWGSLACRLACGQPPTALGEYEHVCVYLRDPAPTGIDVEAISRAQKACFCSKTAH